MAEPSAHPSPTTATESLQKLLLGLPLSAQDPHTAAPTHPSPHDRELMLPPAASRGLNEDSSWAGVVEGLQGTLPGGQEECVWIWGHGVLLLNQNTPLSMPSQPGTGQGQ